MLRPCEASLNGCGAHAGPRPTPGEAQMQTVRRCVVTRARFLQRDRRVLTAMHDSIAAWNHDYPEFPTLQVAQLPGL